MMPLVKGEVTTTVDFSKEQNQNNVHGTNIQGHVINIGAIGSSGNSSTQQYAEILDELSSAEKEIISYINQIRQQALDRGSTLHFVPDGKMLQDLGHQNARGYALLLEKELIKQVSMGAVSLTKAGVKVADLL